MDIFEILNEDKNSDIDLLKSKCQKLIKEHHPDKNLGQESDTFLKVMKVWKILNDSKKFEEVKSIKMTKSKANWDTITLAEMTESDDFYTRNCRCGDEYVLPKDELSSDCDNEVCVECDTCSNTITVVLNHQT